VSSIRLAQIARGIDAVCFDCWGTLLVESNGAATHQRRIEHVRACATEWGEPTTDAAARAALDAAWLQHWDRWVDGVPNSAIDIAHHALEALGAVEPGAAEDLVERLDTTVRSQDVRVLPGARKMLEGLSRAGCRLALVCDTGFTSGEGVRRLLDAKGLLRWLEVQAFSDEIGVAKPHPRIFRHALSAIGASEKTGSAMHVGDLRSTDVAGARALGMTTVRIRCAYDDTSDHPEADLVVDSHEDLAVWFGFGREPRGGNAR